jgi:hypothetical protein
LSCLVLSCLVLSCLVLSCLVLSCLVLSCLVYVLSCRCLPAIPVSLSLFFLPSCCCLCLAVAASVSVVFGILPTTKMKKGRKAVETRAAAVTNQHNQPPGRIFKGHTATAASTGPNRPHSSFYSNFAFVSPRGSNRTYSISRQSTSVNAGDEDMAQNNTEQETAIWRASSSAGRSSSPPLPGRVGGTSSPPIQLPEHHVECSTTDVPPWHDVVDIEAREEGEPVTKQSMGSSTGA